MHALGRLVVAALIAFAIGLCAPLAFAQPGAPAPPPTDPPPSQPSVEVLACVRDHETAQVEAAAGHLKQALDHALACSKDACPSYARSDCLKFVEEYRAKLPSVTIRARGTDGCDAPVAKVSIDGVLVSEQLDGRSLSLDPGVHAVVVQVPGVASEEQKIVATEGEKDRVLTFGDARASRCGKAPPPGTPPPDSPRKFPGMVVGGMVLGGIGLAALATSAGLGIKGLVEREGLEDCKHIPCSEEQIDAVRLNWTIGDVFLGTGLAMVGTAIVLIVVGSNQTPADKPAKPALKLEIGPRAAGAGAMLSGSF